MAHSLLTLLATCAVGYIAGVLILKPTADTGSLSMAVVRLVAGLMLATVGFLLSLVFSVPWFTGPAVVLLLAVGWYRSAAVRLPRPAFQLTWGHTAAATVVLILLLPIVIASLRMAPGEFPPVFYHVDTAYFLEKVHALEAAASYPPESLGVAGGRPANHYGTHAMAAMIARASGMAPHHALFLIVLPMLTIGTAAAAIVLARQISPAVPRALALALLLTATPTLWYPFWHSLGPSLWQAAALSSPEPLLELWRNYEFWGLARNDGQNIASRFIVLAAVAGMAAAPTRGWRLPVFLIGSAVIFKAPTGVALAAGFSVAQSYRAVAERSVRPLVPVFGVVAVFACIYGAFWIVPPLPVEYRTELYPFFHLKYVADQGRLAGLAADVGWLALPGLVLLPVAAAEKDRHSLSLLLAAAAPFIVVNALRAVDLRPGQGVDEMNWAQVLAPVPLLMHAFVLSVAGARWPRIGGGLRAVFVALVTMSVLPPMWLSARYTGVLLTQPEAGHEYVDNRPIAAALRAIPIEGSLVVTNDLRYPAEGFSRILRQMQIPALFGHQAFAVNYVYEVYPFSRERLALQRLLEADHWSDEIDRAARTHGWTHLLVRKDYPHPDTIPLERVFESDLYTVYRFSSGGRSP